MTDRSFRGVVLGSAWRIKNRFARIGPDGQLIMLPEMKIYQNQRWTADALLRRSLFYFDKIVLPTNNMLPQGIEPGIEFLKDQGEVEQEHKDFDQLYPTQVQKMQGIIEAFPNKTGLSGLDAKIAEQVGLFHRSVYDRLDAQQPGSWNYAMVGDGIEFESEPLNRGYSMCLYKCLPVPSGDVPYEDIIEFKRRERTALMDMRGSLDDMYLQIAASQDMPFAAQSETAKLEASITAVQELLTKSQLSYFLGTRNLDLSPDKIRGAALSVAGGFAAHTFSLPGPMAQGVGALVAASFIVKVKDIQLPSTRSGALKYVYRAGLNQIIDSSNVEDDAAPQPNVFIVGNSHHV